MTVAERKRKEDHALLRKMKIRLRLLEKQLGLKDTEAFSWNVDDVTEIAADAIMDTGGIPVAKQVAREIDDTINQGATDADAAKTYSLVGLVILTIVLVLVVSIVALVAVRHRQAVRSMLSAATSSSSTASSVST